MFDDPRALTEQRHQPSFGVSTRQLGLRVLLVSLSVLFTATLVAYAVTRLGNPVWRAPRLPRVPVGLYGSSVLILASSVVFARAVRALRENRIEALVRLLDLALASGVGFLALQTANWVSVSRSAPAHGGSALYAFTFYFLTGLHAAHVVGGLVPLAVVAGRARDREYSSSRTEGVELCAQYWHFLTIVWFALLLALYLGSS